MAEENAGTWTQTAAEWAKDSDDRSRATVEALRREYDGFVDLAARGVWPSSPQSLRLSEVLRDLGKTASDFAVDVAAHKPARPPRYLAICPGKEPEDPSNLRYVADTNGRPQKPGYIYLLMSQFGNETPWTDREIEVGKYGTIDARFTVERHPKQSEEDFDVMARCLGVAGRPPADAVVTSNRTGDPIGVVASCRSAVALRDVFAANGLAERRDLAPLVLCSHTERDVLLKGMLLRHKFAGKTLDAVDRARSTLQFFAVDPAYLEQKYNPRGLNYEPEIHDDRERAIRQRQIEIANQRWPVTGAAINARPVEIDRELEAIEQRRQQLLAERAAVV